MDLPEEIIAKILSELRSNLSSSEPLRNLRVAFTCKALYRMFQPEIARLQASRLRNAIDLIEHGYSLETETTEVRLEQVFRDTAILDRTDDIPQAEGVLPTIPNVRRSETPGEEKARPKVPPLDIQFHLEAHNPSSTDLDAIWSLNSLLSRKQVSSKLAKLQLTFRTSVQWPDWGAKSQAEWGSAVLKLLEAVVKLEGLELELSARETYHAAFPAELTRNSDPQVIARRRSKLIAYRTMLLDTMNALKDAKTHVPKGTTIVPFAIFDDTTCQELECRFIPQELQYQIPKCSMADNRLTSLSLTDRIFHPAPYSFTDLVIRSSPLTHLHLDGCGLADYDWDDILPSWKLPQLSYFTVKKMSIPLSGILLFVKNNPTLTDLELMVDPPPSPACTNELITDLDNVHHKLRNLTATPEMLFQLFSSPFTSPNLDKLTIQEIINRHGTSPQAHREDLQKIVSALALTPCRAPALRRLRLNLAFTEALGSWLLSAIPKDGEPATNLQLALSGLGSIASLRMRAHRTYGSSFWPPAIFVHPNSVVTFIAAFPTLKKVSIHDFFLSPSQEDLEKAELGFWESLGGIWTASLTLKRMKIMGIGREHTQEKAVWNRGEDEPTPNFKSYSELFAR
ncbi:hypothetical protein DFP72DRAFT_925859 [Ephemerocybe angulata]|uniref:Uncharacterized protein n=1 Tax=Ephemerocybe angulata TaxID=980116 RepID=A0A8H6LX93_9AGAR|nr:hypothetical protein DFP72DRAFT_925859 [Tulosesus angulatus]